MEHTDEIKSLLQQEATAVLKELQTLGVQNKNVSQDWIPTPADPSTSEPDPNDVGDRSEDWAERRGTLDALETRYNNITRALTKIASGTYGTCELCNAPIEADRLHANPAARTCKTHINDERQLVN